MTRNLRIPPNIEDARLGEERRRLPGRIPASHYREYTGLNVWLLDLELCDFTADSNRLKPHRFPGRNLA